MATLYVIGNGFDLWHGLPTSYSEFNEFAQETLYELENYYLLKVAEGGPWCDFENSLGDFLWREFYDAHNHMDVGSEDFKPSLVYGLEDGLTEQADELVEAIRECFQAWVHEIDISSAQRTLDLAEDVRFLTFNYTSTLQYIYGIDEDMVLHIHGRAGTNEDLVFGHGETMEEEPELDENGDSNRTMFSDAEGAAKYPFYALQKPVNKILDAHQNFFDSLEDATEIIVIGHSLNKIDLPYFKKLADSAPGARWTICCYEADDEEVHINAMVECGISREFIQICDYSDLEIATQHEYR